MKIKKILRKLPSLHKRDRGESGKGRDAEKASTSRSTLPGPPSSRSSELSEPDGADRGADGPASPGRGRDAEGSDARGAARAAPVAEPPAPPSARPPLPAAEGSVGKRRGVAPERRSLREAAEPSGPGGAPARAEAVRDGEAAAGARQGAAKPSSAAASASTDRVGKDGVPGSAPAPAPRVAAPGAVAPKVLPFGAPVADASPSKAPSRPSPAAVRTSPARGGASASAAPSSRPSAPAVAPAAAASPRAPIYAAPARQPARAYRSSHHRRTSSVSSLEGSLSPEERSEGAVAKLLAKTEGTVSQLLVAGAGERAGRHHRPTTYFGGEEHLQGSSYLGSASQVGVPSSRGAQGRPSSQGGRAAPASPPPLPGEFPDGIAEDPLFGPSAGTRAAARQALGGEGSFSSDDSFSSAISRLPLTDFAIGGDRPETAQGGAARPRRGHSRRGSWADTGSPIRGRRSPSRLSFGARDELFDLALAGAGARGAAAARATQPSAPSSRAPFVVADSVPSVADGGARGPAGDASAAFPWEETIEEARGSVVWRRGEEEAEGEAPDGCRGEEEAEGKAPDGRRGRGHRRRGSASLSGQGPESGGGAAGPGQGGKGPSSPRAVAAASATTGTTAPPSSGASPRAARRGSSPSPPPARAPEVSRPSYADVASGKARTHSVAAELIARLSSGSHRGAELIARLSGASRSAGGSPRAGSLSAAREAAREAAVASMGADAEISGPSHLSRVSNAADGVGAGSAPAAPVSRPTLGTRSTTLPGSLFPPLPRAEEAVRLLEMMTPEERARVDPGMASRYVRATNGDLGYSLKRVRESLEWMAEDRPSQSTCVACGSVPKAHYMQVFGWDAFSRPSIYSCLSVASDRDLEHNRRHMVSCFEQAIAAMPPGVESWGWVLDMHGFGMRDLDPRLAYAFLKISASYYPERLAHAYIIGAPTLFSTFWKGISPFIDPKTKEKITFANFTKTKKAGAGGDAARALREANAKLVKSLERHYPPESIDWLLAEMADNRVKAVADVKYFPVRDLVALVNAPDPARAAASPADARRLERARDRRVAARRKAAGNNLKFLNPDHDHLGTPAYVRDMQGRPDRLPPHLFTRAKDQEKNNVGQP